MKMKKLLALLLCLLMVFTMVGVMSGCEDKDDRDDDDTSDVAPEKDKDENKDTDKDTDNDNNGGTVGTKKTSVEKFVEENYNDILAGMASSMEGSGYDFDCDVAAEGYTLIVTMAAKEFNGLTAAQKQQIQDLYDSMGDQMTPVLDNLRITMPELQAIEYKFYDGNGNFVANMLIKGDNNGGSNNQVDNSKIVSWFNANKNTLINSFESGFTNSSSGLTCNSTAKVEGMGFVITVKINELENLDAATKKNLQDTYDEMDATFEESLEMMQTELPELEYYEVIVCDKNGDKLAVVVAGNKR